MPRMQLCTDRQTSTVSRMGEVRCGVGYFVLAALAWACGPANATKDVTFQVLKDTDTSLPHGDHAICAATTVCTHHARCACSRQLRNCFQCVYSLQLAHFHAIDVLATTSHYFQMHTHAHREPHPPVVLVVDSHNIRLNMTKLACKLQAGLFRSAACSLRSVCC